MVNPFPILFLAMLAHFILRFFVGALLVYYGVSHMRHRHDLKYNFALSWFPYGLFSAWLLALSEIILGTMFILGFYTQIAALLTMWMALKLIIFYKHLASEYLPGRAFYVLLFASSLSLLITGAGAFAFDLPI